MSLYETSLICQSCVLICTDKNNGTKPSIEVAKITSSCTDIAIKECAAYGGVTAHSGMEDVYENPQ